MFSNSRLIAFLLGGAVALNFLLGVAVAGGVVRHGSGVVRVATRQPMVVTAGQAPVDPQSPAPAAPGATVPPITKAPAVTRTVRRPEATTTTTTTAARTPVSPAAGTTSAAVPRANPSSAQILQVMQQLSARSPLFKPTEAHARLFADAVCTGFDQGNSNAQVKAGVFAAAARVPGLTVSSADVDLAIRTAVELICPGHLSKLV